MLERPHRDLERPIIESRDFAHVGREGVAISAGSLAAYGYGLVRYGVGSQSGTLAFTSIMAAQLLHAWTCRSEHYGLFTRQSLLPNPT